MLLPLAISLSLNFLNAPLKSFSVKILSISVLNFIASSVDFNVPLAVFLPGVGKLSLKYDAILFNTSTLPSSTCCFVVAFI